MRSPPIAMSVLAGLAVTLFLAEGSAEAGCMTAGAKKMAAEGDLTQQNFKDALGRLESAFILKLPIPDCLANRNGRVKSFTTIRIVPSTDAIRKQLEDDAGKRTLVVGTALAARSNSDYAPVVFVDITRIGTE